MGLVEGQGVGVYQVTGRIGAGGMGQVWRAHDTRLDRDVALKTLPDAVARDPDQLANFEREAKLLAALNHPHIATIHGLGLTGDGDHYIVLELVEGVPLSERLRRGAMPLAETLALVTQVADALAAAHRRGVIHRDLKPANIMVAPSGWVKVLDFGLARREEPAMSAVAPTLLAPTLMAPTLMAPPASGGSPTSEVSGTPGYMSPEQVLGTPQDARTDVFSLGCVFYECLTGSRTFDGPSLLSIATQILTQEPDWSLLPAGTPPWVAPLLATMLAKDVAARPADMAAVKAACTDFSGASALLGGTRTAVATTTTTCIPHNLPRDATSFIGRDEELARAVASLAAPGLLTLTGMGGCGKTRLALRVAATALEAAPPIAPDGIWFVDLASVSDADRVPDVLAASLGLSSEHGQSSAERALTFLRDRQALVLLDNCEHLLAACIALVERLMDACPQLRLLATSREPLGVRGERVQAVPTLGLPPRGAPLTLASASACEAVQLFVARARLVVPGFALTEASVPTVGEICRRLDGIPLALELAAARVKVLTLEQIRAKLEDRFRLLTGGSRTALPRHQTLRATLQWSYDQLAMPERHLLHALSACSGGWTMEAATALAGEDADEFDVLDMLTRLVDKSLVVVDRGEDDGVRYRFLESVRQYATECAAESGQLDAARVRHLDHFLDLAETAYWKLWSPEQPAWVRRLEAEHENMLEALGTCASAEDGAQKALRLAAALRVWWDIRGYSTIGRRELRTALDRPGAEAPTIPRARALYGIGWLSVRQADFVAARTVFLESLEVFRGVGEQRGLSAALSGLATVARCGSGSAEELQEAQEFYGQALAISREIGDRPSTAASLNNLGDVALLREDYAAARTLFEESAAVFEEVGDREYRAAALHNLGWACMQVDDDAAARRALAASAALLREGGGRGSGAWTLEYSGYLAGRLGEPARAARFLGAAAALRQDTGMALMPAEQAAHDAHRAASTQPTGEEAFTAAWNAGMSLSFPDALAEILAWLNG